MNGPVLRARDAFSRHGRLILVAVGLLLLTLLAGMGLLGVSAGFLTATALSLGVVAGFNLFLPSAAIRAFTLLRIVSRYGDRLLGHVATLRIARDLRVWCFRRLLTLAPVQLGRLRSGEVLARLGADIDRVDGLLVRGLGPVLALASAAAASLALVAWLSAAIASWLALVLVVQGVCIAWHARNAAREEAGLARCRGVLRARLHALYDSVPDRAALPAAAAPDTLSRGFAAWSTALGRRESRRRLRAIDGEFGVALAGALGWVGLLWLGAGAVVDGRMSAPLLAGLCLAALALFEAVGAAVVAWQALQAARVALRRLDALAGQAPALHVPARPRPLPAHGGLRFHQVGYAWPGGRQLLQGLDLEVDAGECVAIRGDSGVGKSTLAALALRAMDPQQGRVCWGGVDLREVDPQDWRAGLGWLPQDAPLFAGTLADNLRLACPEASDEALYAMLARLRLESWACAAGGLSTWLGEGGATVSAGQARRIALGRALLRRPALLVLDEPTDGLDPATAELVLAGLRDCLAQGSAVVLLTHAALPAGVAHRELLLDKGRLRPWHGGRAS